MVPSPLLPRQAQEEKEIKKKKKKREGLRACRPLLGLEPGKRRKERSRKRGEVGEHSVAAASPRARRLEKEKKEGEKGEGRKARSGYQNDLYLAAHLVARKTKREEGSNNWPSPPTIRRLGREGIEKKKREKPSSSWFPSFAACSQRDRGEEREEGGGEEGKKGGEKGGEGQNF